MLAAQYWKHWTYSLCKSHWLLFFEEIHLLLDDLCISLLINSCISWILRWCIRIFQSCSFLEHSKLNLALDISIVQFMLHLIPRRSFWSYHHKFEFAVGYLYYFSLVKMNYWRQVPMIHFFARLHILNIVSIRYSLWLFHLLWSRQMLNENFHLVFQIWKTKITLGYSSQCQKWKERCLLKGLKTLYYYWWYAQSFSPYSEGIILRRLLKQCILEKLILHLPWF